jgi:hypothetical protein
MGLPASAVSAICALTVLTQLKLDGLWICDMLADELGAVTTLVHVQLLSPVGIMHQLLRTLTELPALTRLEFQTCRSPFERTPPKAEGDIIGSMAGLRALRAEVGLADDGAAARLLPGLTTLARFTALTLRACYIEQASALAAVLSATPHLILLDVSRNLSRVQAYAERPCGKVFAEILAPAVCKLTRLLRNGNNRLGLAGVEALAPALEQLSALTCLRYEHNTVGAAGAALLGAALATQLRDLRVGGNLLCGSGVAALLGPLGSLLCLTRLDLRNSARGGNPDASAMFPPLESSEALRERVGVGVHGMVHVYRAQQQVAADAVAGTGDVGIALDTHLLAPLTALRVLGVARCEISVEGLLVLSAHGGCAAGANARVATLPRSAWCGTGWRWCVGAGACSCADLSCCRHQFWQQQHRQT